MNIAKKLKIILKELMRYAKWFLKHYDEFAPIIDLAKRLVEIADAEGGSGGEKRIRVRERIKRLKSDGAPSVSVINYAIERAVAEVKEERSARNAVKGAKR